MLASKILMCLTIVAVCCFVGLYAGVADQSAAASIGLGSYSAGHAGNYAGQSGKDAGEAEVHDFSEAAAEQDQSHYDSLGALGDHLPEEHFPVDYEPKEYEEAAAAATEHHGTFESLANADHHHFEAVHLNEIGSFDDYLSKPVPGIDHGKGAFSYSSTYEFKEPPHDTPSYSHGF